MTSASNNFSPEREPKKRTGLLSFGLGLLLVSTFAVVGAGCGSKVVKEHGKFVKEMCGCKDKDCAQEVNKRFEAWVVKNQSAKGSKGQKEKSDEHSKNYTKCMMSAMAGGPAAVDAKLPEKKAPEKKAPENKEPAKPDEK